jgi:hypothetical protein
LPDGMFSNQKIPIWVNFGVSWNVDIPIICPFVLFYCHFVYGLLVNFVLNLVFFSFLVYCNKKNLATLQ